MLSLSFICSLNHNFLIFIKQDGKNSFFFSLNRFQAELQPVAHIDERLCFKIENESEKKE